MIKVKSSYEKPSYNQSSKELPFFIELKAIIPTYINISISKDRIYCVEARN